ncbi:nmrA-like family domain-containing protein 1 [Amphiura filiformis]|uniref:nmrA-like family domain-containing protein 1 n=1 Tax=Amphiura filiformis TaxID=82378 RepID=UPI003B214431
MEDGAKVIAVFGATGMQGGGVVTALLKNKNFEVRAVTRNTKSDKAKALEKTGVKVVEGNYDDLKCLSSILSGCHGVFAVTNYWEILDVNKEIQQGKNLVDACKAAGVKHLIFSGVEDIRGRTGKPSPLTDGKIGIENYMFASGVPSTAVRYPFYVENFLESSKAMVKKDDNGTFVIGIPMEGKSIGFGSVYCVGNAVATIFASPDAYIGKAIRFNEEQRTFQEVAAILSKSLAPKTFKAGEMTAEQFSKLGFPGAEHMGTMFEFMQAGQYLDYDLELTKQLDPFVTFEDWVKANKEALNAAYQ